MTGAEFYAWLHSKKSIDECEIEFTLDNNHPLEIVLLNIQIVADGEKMIIPYPKSDDPEEIIMAKAASVMLVLNRLAKQIGLNVSFSCVPESDDMGIYDANAEFGKISRNKKGW